MMRTILVLWGLLCLCSSARALQYSAQNVCSDALCKPHEWQKTEKAFPHVLKTLVFAVKQSNLDLVEETLSSVSDPDSEFYGQYLSFEEIGDLVRNPESLDAVKSFLLAHGVVESQIESTPNGEFIVAQTTVEKAELMLDASFFVFENELLPGTQLLRSELISIPDELEPHLDFVGETTQFPGIRARSIQKGPVINGYVTPELINKVYHIDSNVVKSEKSTQSLFESLGQNFSPDDLKQFQKRMGVNESVVAKGMSFVVRL